MNAFIYHEASDIHLKAACPPIFRVGGRILYSKLEPISSATIRELAYKMMTEMQQEKYKQAGHIDFSYEAKLSDSKHIRTRINVFTQKGQTSMALRKVPTKVKSLQELGLEETLGRLCQKKRGLILVTGKAGSGKSTTLASAVDFINSKFRYHIITLEDPIEFVYSDNKSIVSQREVNLDMGSITAGVHEALRQDPDVIVLGEMLDLETIQAAVTAAETGHLVVSTLHTKTAAQTVHRIIDGASKGSREMLRMQLAASLLGVISQRLVPAKDKKSQMVLAYEVLINSPSVSKAISENDMGRIEEIMGQSEYYGMHTLNQHLKELCEQGIITEKAAIQSSHKPEDLALLLSDISGVSKRDSPGKMEWQRSEYREASRQAHKEDSVVVELDELAREKKEKS